MFTIKNVIELMFIYYLYRSHFIQAVVLSLTLYLVHLKAKKKKGSKQVYYLSITAISKLLFSMYNGERLGIHKGKEE